MKSQLLQSFHFCLQTGRTESRSLDEYLHTPNGDTALFTVVGRPRQDLGTQEGKAMGTRYYSMDKREGIVLKRLVLKVADRTVDGEFPGPARWETGS